MSVPNSQVMPKYNFDVRETQTFLCLLNAQVSLGKSPSRLSPHSVHWFGGQEGTPNSVCLVRSLPQL